MNDVVGIKQSGRVPMGQNSRILNWAAVKFAGTATTAKVPVDAAGGGRVEAGQFTATAQPSGDEKFWFSKNSDGSLAVGSDGCVTLNRAATAVTADLTGTVFIILM